MYCIIEFLMHSKYFQTLAGTLLQATLIKITIYSRFVT